MYVAHTHTHTHRRERELKIVKFKTFLFFKKAIVFILDLQFDAIDWMTVTPSLVGYGEV